MWLSCRTIAARPAGERRTRNSDLTRAQIFIKIRRTATQTECVVQFASASAGWGRYVGMHKVLCTTCNTSCFDAAVVFERIKAVHATIKIKTRTTKTLYSKTLKVTPIRLPYLQVQSYSLSSTELNYLPVSHFFFLLPIVSSFRIMAFPLLS